MEGNLPKLPTSARIHYERDEHGRIFAAAVLPTAAVPIRHHMAGEPITDVIEGDVESDVSLYQSMSGLFNLNNSLTEQQRRAVMEIGFGGLLELKADHFSPGLAKWLLDSYNPISKLLIIGPGKECYVTSSDVEDIFMLPRAVANPVNTIPSMKKCQPDEDLHKEWKDRFGCRYNNRIALKDIVDRIHALPEGGNEFKQLYVMYAMSDFLAPTPHNNLDMSLIGVVTRSADLSKLDWCSFVVDRLEEAVTKYKSKHLRCCGGCVIVLQLMYFHRLRWKGIAAPSDRPLIQHWNTVSIRSRVREEKKNAQGRLGRLGMGMWDSVTYPISQPPSLQNEPQPEQDKAAIRVIQFNLLPHSKTDEEIQSEASDEFAALMMIMKRDIEVISAYHVERLSKFREKVVSSQAGVGNQSDEHGEVPSFSQLLSNPDVLKQIDDIVEGVMRAKVVVEDVIVPPTFNLGIDDLDDFETVPIMHRSKRARPHVSGTPLQPHHSNPSVVAAVPDPPAPVVAPPIKRPRSCVAKASTTSLEPIRKSNRENKGKKRRYS